MRRRRSSSYRRLRSRRKPRIIGRRPSKKIRKYGTSRGGIRL